MMTITNCPRCGKDFMYDPHWDWHLERTHINNTECNDSESDVCNHKKIYFICQDCDIKETKEKR